MERLHGELEALRSGSSDLQEMVASLPSPPPEVWEKSVELTWKIYRFRAEWVPVRCSSKQTGFLSAGVLLEIDHLLPLVFLHGAFGNRKKRMGLFG